MTRVCWVTVDTPIGPVSAACTEAGVVRVRFGPPPEGVKDCARAEPGGLAAAARDQLAGYFAGTRTVFGLPLDLGACPAAQRDVLVLLAESVPFGQTITYGELDARLATREGQAGLGARAIGTIMGSNPVPLVVPCHRVVAADGLGGFSGGCGIELKRWLLTFEGALPAMLDFGAPVLPLG